MSRHPLRAPRSLAWVVDACLWLVLGITLLVVATGGGRMQVAGLRISVRSAGNPLLIAGVLLALRGLLAHVPILGLRRTTLFDLATWCRVALDRMLSILDRIDGRTIARVLLIAVAAATAIRIANACVHFGFLTGDDVEIHEMSLGRALGRDWPAWEIRNAFYPMAFIFPGQRLLVALGVTDVFTLVLAGRLVVTAVAAINIVLVYRIGERLFGHRGQALVAAVLFACNHLHMVFGSAELPRVVASTFMLGAFGMSLRGSVAGACAAGALMGVGATLRFGEIVFLAPALVTIVCWNGGEGRSGRWRRGLLIAATLAVACAVTSLAIVAISDLLYWGTPFRSLRAIVDYTLVRRLSSRGYEPVWHYATHLTEWSNGVLVGLALLAAGRGGGRPLTWAILPIAILSLLPHKEARYVIATIPFWSLAAARGLWLAARAVVEMRSVPHAATAALSLVALLVGGCLYDASLFRVNRSEEAVRLAWEVAASEPGGLAADQLWRFGGRLYLDGRSPLIDLDPARAADESVARAAFCTSGVRWVSLRSDRVTAERTRALAACGFARVRATAEYVLFRKPEPRV